MKLVTTQSPSIYTISQSYRSTDNISVVVSQTVKLGDTGLNPLESTSSVEVKSTPY